MLGVKRLRTDRRTLLIHGYIRENKYENLIKSIIPEEIKKLIEEFYPIYIDFNGSKMEFTPTEKETLTTYLLKVLDNNDKNVLKLSSQLLYLGDRDGLTADIWHKKCDHNINTLTIVKTNYNHVFGCFASLPFEADLNDYKHDMKAFLCLIRTSFQDDECPKFYPYVPPPTLYGKHSFYNGKSYGPCFGYPFDVGIFSSNGSYPNYCYHSKITRYPNATGNELCGGNSRTGLEDVKCIDYIKRNRRRSKKTPFEIKLIETHKIYIQM